MSVDHIIIHAVTKNGSREIRLPAGSTVEDILKQLELSVSAQIVLRGKKPLPLDETVGDGDELRIIETFSGG